MALPGNITTITVTGTYANVADAVAGGAVVFTPSSQLADVNGEIILTANPVTATLSNGAFSVVLPCTDNTTIRPTPFYYTVFQAIGGTWQQPFNITLPSTLGSTVDMSALVPQPSMAQPNPGLYVTSVNGQSGAVTIAGLNLPAGDLGGTAAVPEVVATHLAAPLPLAQGGTGVDAASDAALLAGMGALPVAGGTMSGAIAMGGNPLTGVSDVAVTGLAGATAGMRAAGATVSGPPLSGTFTAGDTVTDQAGQVWVCTAAGTPGTWKTAQVMATQALTPLWAALGNRAFSRCDVVALGDSITEGQHSTTFDGRWLGRLRDRLRAAYPVTGAGITAPLPSDGQYLCAPSVYAPGTQTTLGVSSATYGPVSSANVNTGTFTAPPSGAVVVTASFVAEASAASPDRGIALAAHGTTSPLVCSQWVWEDSASIARQFSVPMLVTGLTPGTSYNFDLMAAVASGSLTFYAFSQTSTSIGNSSSSYGSPITMTVQAAGIPGTGGRGFIGATSSGETSFTWPVTAAGSPTTGATLGPKSEYVQLNGAGQSLTFTLYGDSADIMWCQVAFGGSFSWAVDGGSPTTVSTNGSGTVDGHITHISLGTAGTHTLVLSWVSGSADIDGVVEYCSDYTSGIQVHDAGHFGWATGNWVTVLANGAAGPAAAIAALTPNAIVISIGVNDQFSNVVPATFGSNLQSMITSLKGQLTSPYPAFILNMYPPRTGQSGYTYPWSSYVAQAWAVAAADTSGPGSTSIVSVCDFTQGVKLPGADTDVYGIWQSGDLVHPSNLGHQAIADRIAAFVTQA